jgi:hypothetical protein
MARERMDRADGLVLPVQSEYAGRVVRRLICIEEAELPILSENPGITESWRPLAFSRVFAKRGFGGLHCFSLIRVPCF